MKKMAIIGGGVSGLACLHYAQKFLSVDWDIQLYEQASRLGGHIHSIREDSYIIENGPNGFLNDRPATLDLLHDLNLDDDIIEADQVSQKRFILHQQQLCQLPTSPMALFTSPLLGFKASCRIFAEPFQSVSQNASYESIDQFISRRFGSGVSQRLVDPFVSGIFAGDIKRLHMASALPQVYRLEQENGSIIKGILAKRRGNKKAHMVSLKNGMGQVIEAISSRYQSQIHLSSTIRDITKINADHVVMTTPAESSAAFLLPQYPDISVHLRKLTYVPMLVVAMVFNRDQWAKPLEGFGYLSQSTDQSPLLGVVFESNVFTNRCPGNKILLRLMFGGRHHMQLFDKAEAYYIDLGLQQLNRLFGLKGVPLKIWTKAWPKAIVQYETDYPHWLDEWGVLTRQCPQISWRTHFLGGISFNDLIANAKHWAQTFKMGTRE